MYRDYQLDERKLRTALSEKGFNNFGELLRKATLHRNSLNDYLDGHRSVFSAVTRKICSVLDCDPLSLLTHQASTRGSDPTAKALLRLLGEITNHRPDLTFFLLGSRAKGNARQMSDWDVAVSGGSSKLSVDDYLTIKSKVEDGAENFPVEVDLINFDEAPRWFISNIDYVPKFLIGNERAFSHAIGVINGVRKN